MKLLIATYPLSALWSIILCQCPHHLLTLSSTTPWLAVQFVNGTSHLVCLVKSGTILSLVMYFAMDVPRCTLWMAWRHMLLTVYISQGPNTMLLSISLLFWCVDFLFFLFSIDWCYDCKFTPKHLVESSPQPLAALMEFHPTSNPPPSFNIFLTSMVGCAFLEWNLDVGVSVDVWRILSTSGVACNGCKRVFNGWRLCTQGWCRWAYLQGVNSDAGS